MNCAVDSVRLDQLSLFSLGNGFGTGRSERRGNDDGSAKGLGIRPGSVTGFSV